MAQSSNDRFNSIDDAICLGSLETRLDDEIFVVDNAAIFRAARQFTCIYISLIKVRALSFRVSMLAW